MTVPATVSLKDLVGVTGNVEVQLTITPKALAIGTIALSTVHVGSTSLSISKSGNTFTFSSTLPAGATVLTFNLSGFIYSAKKQDSGTFDVTSLITFQQGTATKQLKPVGPSITLPQLK